MLVVLLSALLIVAGYAWFQNERFEASISTLRDRIVAPNPLPAAEVALPEMVRAYAIRAGGSVGGPSVVHVQHRAMLTTAQGRSPIQIEADQWLGTSEANLVWRGRGSMFGIPVTVLDSFVDGAGRLEARLAGTLPVASGIGPEFDKGELQRYLSELPVHPDAILNNSALLWRQLSENVVEVSGPSSSGVASIRFVFNGAGDIIGLEAPDRPMTVGKTTVPTPWKGTYSAYKQFGRYRIPSYGEVGWVLPDGLFTYWRGEITVYEPLPATRP